MEMGFQRKRLLSQVNEIELNWVRITPSETNRTKSAKQIIRRDNFKPY